MAENDVEDISKLQGWKTESENDRSQYEERWVRNMDLSKGNFSEDELNRSKVRKRSKLFFRKNSSYLLYCSFLL